MTNEEIKKLHPEYFKEVNVRELKSAMEGFRAGVSFSNDDKVKTTVDLLIDLVNNYL